MTGRLLVAYSNGSNYVSTTAEYLQSLSQFSGFNVRYVHVTNDAELDFDLNDFDAIFQSYCARIPFDNFLSPSYLDKLKDFRGIKLLAVQDEYENTHKLITGIKEIGYHVVFTCMSPELTERICPRADFPRTEFITTMTGYVPEHLTERGRHVLPLQERPIRIGYRCRQLSAYFGRLGFDKFEIGRRMREVCEARGIPHDIEWSDDKRIYGDAWYEFIGSCRANLGSETGSNVFDLDGTIRAKYEELSNARGGPVPFEEFCEYTDPIETKYDIGQVSPRIFEAAAMRTPLILFSGRYMGVIKPDTHYIELKKDFSNIDEVLARLDDVGELERMAARAYDRLVDSGDFGYRRFVDRIDATIIRKAREFGVSLRPSSKALGFNQENFNLAELGSLREQPTVAPHHPAVFFYKHAERTNKLLTKEVSRLNEVYIVNITRLNNEILRINEIYTAELTRLGSEISRLNEIYATETARLGSEISRLNEIYATETARLGSEISRLNEIYTAEIARLNDEISRLNDEISRLNEVYTAEIARLNDAISQLNVVYTAEPARAHDACTAELARLNDNYTFKIARLEKVHTAEIARLNAAIEELEGKPADQSEVCSGQSHSVEGGHLNVAISGAAPQLGQVGAPGPSPAFARTLLLHPGVRQFGRKVLTRLPDRIEQLVKARVGKSIARM